MTSTEAQIDRSRRQLGRLLGHMTVAIEDAAALLEPKAQRAPASAEAEAHRRLTRALGELRSWIESAGPSVGVTLQEAPRGANGPMQTRSA